MCIERSKRDHVDQFKSKNQNKEEEKTVNVTD